MEGNASVYQVNPVSRISGAIIYYTLEYILDHIVYIILRSILLQNINIVLHAHLGGGTVHLVDFSFFFFSALKIICRSRHSCRSGISSN